MTPTDLQALRQFIRDALDQHGDHAPLDDHDPLFSSGRLDSFTMMNLVMFLEETFQVDFSDFEFDVALVDHIAAIAAFVDGKRA